MKALTDKVTHGIASTYRSYGCKCDPCKAAHAARQADEARSRAERLASGEAAPTHGKAATYSNYRCRCDECRAAWSLYLNERKAKTDA